MEKRPGTGFPCALRGIREQAVWRRQPQAHRVRGGMKSPPEGGAQMLRRTRRCEREGAQMRLSAMRSLACWPSRAAATTALHPGLQSPGDPPPGCLPRADRRARRSAPVESSGTATAGDASGLASRVAARLDAPAGAHLALSPAPSQRREIAVRADEPMNALSVIKIPVMVLAYRDAEAGTLDLTNATRSARRICGGAAVCSRPSHPDWSRPIATW